MPILILSTVLISLLILGFKFLLGNIGFKFEFILILSYFIFTAVVSAMSGFCCLCTEEQSDIGVLKEYTDAQVAVQYMIGILSLLLILFVIKGDLITFDKSSTK